MLAWFLEDISMELEKRRMSQEKSILFENDIGMNNLETPFGANTE